MRGGSVALRAPQRLAVGKRRSLDGGARHNESGGASGVIYGHVRDVNLEEMELRPAPRAPPGALLPETPPAGHEEFVHAM